MAATQSTHALQMLAHTKMVDTFRRQHGDNVHGFTKVGYQVDWSGDPEVPKPRRLEPAHKRSKNAALGPCLMRRKGYGWRLDYVLESAALADRCADAFVLQDWLGSDHVPVGLGAS